MLIFRSFRQAFACSGSIGHGLFFPLYCKNPANKSNTPDTLKVHALYFENVTSQGAEETKPARDAPAPIVTSNAGRAQQSKVLDDANKLTKGVIVSFQL